MAGTTLFFDLLARDQASKTFKAVGDQAVLAATKIGKAQTAAERAAIRMGAVGDKLTKSMTLPLVAAAGVAVEQAARYQANLNVIKVATDQTSAAMAAASKGLMTIATDTGTGLNQLTDSLYVVEKSGLRGAKALDTVRAAAQGAKAEGADLGTATNALTSIMASYGKSMSNPIAAEDALIRGAGLAKTTYQDFAASLSNVIPLASALHISFGQIAGAIDTMTQHGESAQRSTENLNNLIRNLAGSNNVASSALGQIGLSSLKLQKILASPGADGGLLGALNAVEDALSAHSHGGFVAVSAFKQSQIATHDLNVELGHMPPQLVSISKQFEAGTLGYSTYNKAVKALGGQQYELGKNFEATMGQAKGFNSALRSGNSDVSSAAAMLSKLLGGATGMNTALMLGGASAQRFATDTSAVAAAAGKASTNVLGWSATQQTFNVKLDKARESLQVLAVEVGTALLPALSQIAEDGAKAFAWVDNLDHSQKELLGWGVGALAAVGPVLSLTGRLSLVGSSITSFSTNAVSQLGRFNTSIAMNAEGISAAAGRIGSALGAAGLGVAVGELTQNSSTATKSIGVLGSALAGAAIGSAGGPLGVAIGALAGGVGDLATQWLGSGHAAKAASAATQAAIAVQKQSVDELYQSLLSVNGAYNMQYENTVRQKLLAAGVLQLAQQAHINPATVVQAALGNTKAVNQVQTGIGTDIYGGGKPAVGYTATGQPYLIAQGKYADAAQKLNDALGKTGVLIGKAQSEYQLYVASEGQSIVSTRDLAKGVAGLRVELKGAGTALTTSSNAQIASSAFAVKNTAIIEANIQAVNQSAAAQLKHGDSVRRVADNYVTQIGALSSTLHQMGFNQAGVQQLIDTYGRIPKSVATNLIKRGVLPADIQAIIAKYAGIPSRKNTDVTANAAPALSVIQRISDELAGIPRNVVSDIEIHRSEVNQYQSFNPPSRHATGGTITGPGTGTSDSVLMWGSNGEEVINAKQSAKHRRLLKAINAGVGGFASGGTVGGVVPKAITVTRVAGHREYVYGGQNYSSLAAAENAQARATQSAASAVEKAMSKAVAETLKLGAAAGKSGSDLSTAFGDVLANLKAADVTASVRARLSRIDNAAVLADNRRVTAAAKVAALQSARAQEVSSVRSAVTGSFNIVSAGTTVGSSNAVALGSILAQSRQAEVVANRFAAGIRRLRAEGLALGVVSQLAEAGPSAYPQVAALLTATPKQLRQLNSAEAGISAAGMRVGNFVGNQQFGGRIGVADRQAHQDSMVLGRKLDTLEKAVRELAHAQEKHQTVVDLSVDSRAIARAVQTGMNKNRR